MTAAFPAERTSEIVSDRQRAFFEAYGYLRFPGLFAADVAEIGAAFDAVFADPAHPPLDINYVGHRFHSHYAIGHFVDLHPRLAAVADDDRTTTIAKALIGRGAEFVGSDGSIYCCETEWHYDTPVEQRDRRHLKMAFYLDDLDEDAGALRVLPLSHHDASLYGGALAPYLGFEGGIEERTGVAAEDLPHWTLDNRAGDLLVWDFRLMHSSYGSTQARRQFTLNFRGEPFGAPAATDS